MDIKKLQKAQGKKIQAIQVDNLSTYTESITLELEDGTQLIFYTLHVEIIDDRPMEKSVNQGRT